MAHNSLASDRMIGEDLDDDINNICGNEER